jgi:acylphosphatase
VTGERIHRRAVLDGRVQGVFLRDSTRREAVQRGVAGAARNRPDGTVEVVLEGPAEEVAAVLAWLRDGPPHARVDSVQVSEGPLEGLTGFAVE